MIVWEIRASWPQHKHEFFVRVNDQAEIPTGSTRDHVANKFCDTGATRTDFDPTTTHSSMTEGSAFARVPVETWEAILDEVLRPGSP